MKLKDFQHYKVKLLVDKNDCHGFEYGKAGDVIVLRHNDRYYENNCLCVIEGHGYGTNFKMGVDIEIIEEVL